MLRDSAWWLLVSFLLMSSVCATENAYLRCNCDDDIGLLSIDNILDCQRVSDFLIAIAYFSIPIELLYFVSSSNLPFKWILVEFIAFIVLCGMTHFLNAWTYGPHRFQILLALTVSKMLTAVVSCATAVTVFALLPWLLKVKIREHMLRKKACDLNKEVGIIRRQNEVWWHVRMLTQEIRKSLDRHTILYTTLLELSRSLELQNCAVWMPNEDRTEMILTHQLEGRADQSFYSGSIPYLDLDVRRVKESQQVIVLNPDSAFGVASSGGLGDPGAVAAIRVPMLRVSNFKRGTAQLTNACYGILVLVAPSENDRKWHPRELGIIKAIADQVAVAISHAAILEESQIMRAKLAEQNHVLQIAQKNAMMASQARNLFQRVMSDRTRKPMHTISGLLSLLQDSPSSEQQLIINTIAKTNNVLTVLVNDVMDDLPTENGKFPSEPKGFRLHSFVREAGCLARCLCVYNGCGFTIEVDRSLPDHVVGDERSVFQVILHMVGNLLDSNSGGRGGSLRFRAFSQHGKELRGDQRWVTWASDSSDDGCVFIRFEVEIVSNGGPPEDESASSSLWYSQRHYREADQGDFSFRVCQKLVELMQGNIWVFSNQQGCPQSMVLVLRFRLGPSTGIPLLDSGESSTQPLPAHRSEPLLDSGESSTQPLPAHRSEALRGLQVLLADEDHMNRAVTYQMLEKLGCCVTAVSSGYECLSAIGPTGSSSCLQVVLLDPHFHDINGLQVAMEIRKLCSHSAPLIVALTTIGEPYLDCEKLKEFGINAVIRKPVVLEDLAGELKRALLQANKGIE